MTTGKKVSVIPPPEVHASLVQKAADLGLMTTKVTQFRPAAENLDEINSLLVAAGLPTKQKVHFVPILDAIEWMTSI